MFAPLCHISALVLRDELGNVRLLIFICLNLGRRWLRGRYPLTLGSDSSKFNVCHFLGSFKELVLTVLLFCLKRFTAVSFYFHTEICRMVEMELAAMVEGIDQYSIKL